MRLAIDQRRQDVSLTLRALGRLEREQVRQIRSHADLSHEFLDNATVIRNIQGDIRMARSRLALYHERRGSRKESFAEGKRCDKKKSKGRPKQKKHRFRRAKHKGCGHGDPPYETWQGFFGRNQRRSWGRMLVALTGSTMHEVLEQMLPRLIRTSDLVPNKRMFCIDHEATRVIGDSSSLFVAFKASAAAPLDPRKT